MKGPATFISTLQWTNNELNVGRYAQKKKEKKEKKENRGGWRFFLLLPFERESDWKEGLEKWSRVPQSHSRDWTNLERTHQVIVDAFQWPFNGISMSSDHLCLPCLVQASVGDSLSEH